MSRLCRHQLRKTVSDKGSRAACELHIPHHKRARQYHKQEGGHVETRMHTASKTGDDRLRHITSSI